MKGSIGEYHLWVCSCFSSSSPHVLKVEGNEGLVLWHINHWRVFNTKSIFRHVKFHFKQFNLTLSTQFSSVWPISRTLSGATTLGQSGPGSDGNKGVLHIPQISITEVSPSDYFVSYLGHSLGESYPSAEMQSVYYAAPGPENVSTQECLEHFIWRCTLYDGTLCMKVHKIYRCRKWNKRSEFKPKTGLFEFNFALVSFGKAWVHSLSFCSYE